MDKLFVDRYIVYINKTPLMRDLEKDVFEYITMYNKIQQMIEKYDKNDNTEKIIKELDTMTLFDKKMDNYLILPC